MRVEVRTGEQAPLAEHGRRHLLGLVDEDDRPPAGGAERVTPTGAQRLEPAPSMADPHRDPEDIAEFAVDVAQVTLAEVDDADGETGPACEARG